MSLRTQRLSLLAGMTFGGPAVVQEAAPPAPDAIPVALPPPAAAPANSTGQLVEVGVTATRRKESAHNIAGGVTALTRGPDEPGRRQQPRRVLVAVAGRELRPGLAGLLGGVHPPRFRSRHPGRDTDRGGHVLRRHPADRSGRAAGDAGHRRLDAKRIEVLRGPQGCTASASPRSARTSPTPSAAPPSSTSRRPPAATSNTSSSRRRAPSAWN